MNEIFHDQLYPRWFSHLRQPQGAPRVVFVGGQPGAGKSVRERAITESLQSHDPNTAVEINGDDYRAFHPRYWEYMRSDDISAAAKIDKDNGRFIEMAIEATLAIKCHSVIEGTFRRPEVVAKTAEKYHQANYRSEAILLAVHPILSELGIVQRYIEQKIIAPYARYTLPDAHEVALLGIPVTTSKLITEASADKFSIVDRNGEELFSSDLRHMRLDTRGLLARDALAVISEKHTILNDEELGLAHEQLSDLRQLSLRADLPAVVKNRLATISHELSQYKV